MDSITRRAIEFAAGYGSGKNVYDACSTLYHPNDLEEAAEIIEKKAGIFATRIGNTVFVDDVEISKFGVYQNRGGATQ